MVENLSVTSFLKYLGGKDNYIEAAVSGTNQSLLEAVKGLFAFMLVAKRGENRPLTENKTSTKRSCALCQQKRKNSLGCFLNHQGPDQKNTYIQELVRKGVAIRGCENLNILESRMEKKPDLKASEERMLSADYCCRLSYLRSSYPVSFK